MKPGPRDHTTGHVCGVDGLSLRVLRCDRCGRECPERFAFGTSCIATDCEGGVLRPTKKRISASVVNGVVSW